MAREPEEIRELRRALGQRLNTFRQAACLTQGQLGKVLYCDRTAISKIEAAERAKDRSFWQRADEHLDANGALTAAYDVLERARLEHGRQEREAALAEVRSRAQQWRAQANEHAAVVQAGPVAGDVEEVAMAPLTRRELLRYGVAATVAPALAPAEAGASLPLPEPAVAPWASAIYGTVLNPGDAARRIVTECNAFDMASLEELHKLRRIADRAMAVSLTSDYAELTRSLPRLLGYAEAASISVPGNHQRVVLQVLSDIYAIAGWTLIKADSAVGAWTAAQRAVQLAEQAEDVLRVAAATRCLAEVHMRARNLGEATRVAFLATVHLDAAPREQRRTAISLRGASLLSAAAASARRGDRREAYASLKAAEVCATELGEDRTDLASVFGPTNVAIHRVAIAIELGDPGEAVRHIPAVRLDLVPESLGERKARYLIDVARTRAELKDDNGAVEALAHAELIAPDEVRNHRLTRQLVPQLLTTERQGSALRGLAARCSLLN
ncbi:helix-turn-helix domain-containing protein [Kutzneria albida]|uniref:HTH cro/C1-type domain-containing protein n=1 Tax=Kutzneria albida DSM 43870 TaxID=1449976 RepID=W5WCS5_9PSEU|nr:helix-turn-helix transcriptional regulator [Kutzneria albida]AHH98560.1 hypothetical protein KALB_5198 [Kutzneria albida DSM 43870]